MTTYYVDGAVGNDVNPGTSEGSGNAWATIQKAADTALAGDIVYVKASVSYAEQIDFDTNAGTVTSRITFIGYSITPGDNGEVTVTGSGSRAFCFVCNGTADYVTWRNFTLTDATSACISTTTNATIGARFFNCIFQKGSSTATDAWKHTAYFVFDRPVVIGCTFQDFSSANGGFGGANCLAAILIKCKILNNTNVGILINSYRGPYTIKQCIISGNGGDGINVGQAAINVIICDNTIEGNGGDGIDINGTNHSQGGIQVFNNIIANHSGAGDVGLRIGTLSGSTNTFYIGNNAYYNNTTHRSGAAATPDEGGDIDLSVDPFVDSANDDFRLNNTAGGGADVRAVEFDYGSPNISYADIGALQHEDSGVGGGNTYIINKIKKVR